MNLEPLEKLTQIYGEPEDMGVHVSLDPDYVTFTSSLKRYFYPHDVHFYYTLLQVYSSTTGSAHKVIEQVGIKGRNILSNIVKDGFELRDGRDNVYNSSACYLLEGPEIVFCGELNRETRWKQMKFHNKLFARMKGITRPEQIPIEFQIMVVSKNLASAQDLYMNMMHAANLVYNNNPEESNAIFGANLLNLTKVNMNPNCMYPFFSVLVQHDRDSLENPM